MNPSDVAVLQKAYGDELSRYLNSLDIAPVKTASGAFLIPSRQSFETCEKLIFERARSETLRANVSEKETHRVSKSVGEKTKNIPETQMSFKNSSVATNLTISFSTRRRMKPPKSLFRFSHLTRKRGVHSINSRLVFEEMMKTDVGACTLTSSQLEKACRGRIYSIISKFLLRHKKFQYFAKLQHILKKNGGKGTKNVLGITLKQFQEFIYYVFALVIPKPLFGNCKNAKILREVLKEFYLSPYKAPICLKTCVDNLMISEISWLHPVKDISTRQLIIAKVTKWLFESFFVPMMKSVFLIQKSLCSEKQIIMSARKWKSFRNTYIDKQLNARHIAKVDPDDKFRVNDVPYGNMVICPKSKGVRPIYRLRYTNPQKKDIAILRVFLQQQFLQRYEFVNMETLYSIWLKQVTMNEEDVNRKANLVTCDVSDAFGSIKQKILFDIVNRMINEIPDGILRIQWYQLLLPKAFSHKSQVQYRQWFSRCPAAPIVPNCALIGISRQPQHKIVCMKKDDIRDKLEKYIFQQTIAFRGKLYKVRQGVLQGSPLSPILSDIYYQHMTAEVFGMFIQSGTLLRYVDDFIYITKDENSAKRFLQLITRNIPKYNCHFKKGKIETNVQGQIWKKRSEWVSYTGFKLNGDTMEVLPNYETPEIQYTKWINKVADTNSLSNFAERLMNLSCLKLKRIILDPKINSLSGLSKSAGLAAKVMATRCVILVSTIFEDANQYRDGIMNKIQAAVKKLELVFKRSLSASAIAVRPTPHSCCENRDYVRFIHSDCAANTIDNSTVSSTLRI